MYLPFIVLLIPPRTGVISESTLLVAGHVLMLVGMAAAMFWGGGGTPAAATDSKHRTGRRRVIHCGSVLSQQPHSAVDHQGVAGLVNPTASDGGSEP